MTLLPPRLGRQFLVPSFLSLLVTCLSLLITSYYPLSIGDQYQQKLAKWHHLVIDQNFTRADELAKQIDPQDIAYLAQKYHPKYITQAISNLLKRTTLSTDDLIEVSLLYHTIGDQDSSKLYLEKAQKQDPVRSDIDRLFHQLF